MKEFLKHGKIKQFNFNREESNINNLWGIVVYERCKTVVNLLNKYNSISSTRIISMITRYGTIECKPIHTSSDTFIDQTIPPVLNFARMRTIPERFMVPSPAMSRTPSIESRGKCPICLDSDSQIMYVFLGCGHVVCKGCLRLNIDQESQCAICRKFSKLIKLYI